MSTLGPEKVFPAPGTPAPAAAPAAGKKSLTGQLAANKKPLMWAGAGVVALAALWSSRGAAADAETSDTVDSFELDTTETDLYNELQPELEGIGDQIDDLRDSLGQGVPRPPAPSPRPHKPGPHRPGDDRPHPEDRHPRHRPNKPAPKPGRDKHRPRPPKDKGGREVYTVKRGDTLRAIAHTRKVKGGWARLYTINRHVIEAAAKSHGHKTSRGGNLIFPGTVLRVP